MIMDTAHGVTGLQVMGEVERERIRIQGIMVNKGKIQL